MAFDIEMIDNLRSRQAGYVRNSQLSLAHQLERLPA
jgi:hypothetical protein